MKWYVLQAWANYENKVAKLIEDKTAQNQLAEFVGQVIVPKETITEVRGNKRVKRERKFFPGYVLVKADLTPKIFQLIVGIPEVTGFVGGDKNNPTPISDAEAEQIIGQMLDTENNPKPLFSYLVGEKVRILNGAFADYEGFISEINEGRGKIKIEIPIMGQTTPVELNLDQVEKVVE